MRRRDDLSMMRFAALAALLWLIGGWAAPGVGQSERVLSPQDAGAVRVGVLGLFHPRELVLRPVDGSGLVLQGGDRRESLSIDSRVVVTVAANGQIEIRAGADGGKFDETSLFAHGESSEAAGPADFLLEVPGKLGRRYEGTIEIRARENLLEAVVSMPLETAVASVVEAESPPGAGAEALKAQAVAARSFLVARQTSHADFDFCDTTHCQFLRSPPLPGSPASAAARATAGLVLTWHDESTAQEHTLAAMYARSCGGRTKTLAQIGVHAKGYPYYAVRCAYCNRHPEVWKREETSNPQTERGRLAFNRIHGWGSLPSVATAGDGSRNAWISGRGTGHGVGLCQLGAAEMARQGAGFAAILAHYYPNTRLTAIPRS